jgi:hypothetical protein
MKDFGMQTTDHWIVCSGLKVVSDLLATYQAAREEAEQRVLDGCERVSIQHVGVSNHETATAALGQPSAATLDHQKREHARVMQVMPTGYFKGD